jgi:hypothetical protein
LGVKSRFVDIFTAIHQEVAHLEQDEVNKFEVTTSNLDLNLKYIKNELTDYDWKIQLQRREKENERNIAFREVLEMAIGVAHDLFDRFRTDKLTVKDLVTTLGEFFKLEGYTNNQLDRMRRVFDSKMKLRVDWFDRTTERDKPRRRPDFLAFWNEQRA